MNRQPSVSARITGAAVPDSRKYPAIYKRIEMLAELNDQYRAAINAGDKKRLVSISRQYMQLKCICRANEILIQAGARFRWKA